MADDLELTPEAEADIDDAYRYYERQRVGLGEDFLSQVDAGMHAICRSPEMHQRIFKDYRRHLVRRFPYAIFYEHADGKVIVYCVFHTSRDPAAWKARLP